MPTTHILKHLLTHAGSRVRLEMRASIASPDYKTVVIWVYRFPTPFRSANQKEKKKRSWFGQGPAKIESVLESRRALGRKQEGLYYIYIVNRLFAGITCILVVCTSACTRTTAHACAFCRARVDSAGCDFKKIPLRKMRSQKKKKRSVGRFKSYNFIRTMILPR